VSDNRVAFIGPKAITPVEHATLSALGTLLARAGAELHTSKTTDANLAVAKGFMAAGGKPNYHTSGLHKTANWIVAYGDAEFIEAVKHSRGWFEAGPLVQWDFLDSQERLETFNNSISKAIEEWRTVTSD
jgi:hypothetical protein